MKDVEIRKLKPGEKITESGFYDMPLSVHHSQPCDGVSVTSGVLRKMELASPADVWAYHQLNPNARSVKVTPAMYMGAAQAALIAGGMDELRRQFFVLKKEVPRRPTDYQWEAYREGRGQSAGIRSCKAWEIINEDPRLTITYDEKLELLEMADALRKDPAALMAMDGLPEITMAVFDEESKLWILARPDTVNLNGMTSDYKRIATTTGTFNAGLVDKRITQDGYGMQLALAGDVFNRLMGFWPTDNVIVAQWVTYPYHVIPRPISEEDIEEDVFLNRRAIKKFRECLDSGHWPGPGETVNNHRRPAFISERTRNDMQAEGFKK